MEERSNLPTTYIAFGDGSSGGTGTYYGFILVPEDALDDALDAFGRVKSKHGGPSDASLHCRELFNDAARKNSAWRHLNAEGVIGLCSEILREIAVFRPIYLLGIMPVAHYPKRFRLRGKYGPPDIVHNIDDKWRSLWVYQIVAAMLDPVEVRLPSDPLVTPNPKNQPWWRTEVELVAPGYRVRQVFLDREDTTITWFSKNFKWISVAQNLVVRGTLGRSHLPIEANGRTKHPFLDLADIFVWSVARGFSTKPIKFVDFEGEVQAVVFAFRGEELEVGGNLTSAKGRTQNCG